MRERAHKVAKTVGRVAVRSAAMATAQWRPAPDIVIIGVKRGGTTSLFRDLERHPAMCPLVPSARRLPLRENMKGVHYFDTNHVRSNRWYRSHFPTTHTLRRRADTTAGRAFTAEASPYYFFHPLGARRAVLELPDSTVFAVMLRDPVERTISHWSEQTRNGVEQLPLAEAIAAEDQRIAGTSDQLANGSVALSHAHEQQSYVAQSFYADSLQRWFDAAGRDRLVVLFSEDYSRDPAGTIATITDRIGAERSNATGAVHRNAAQRPSQLDPALDAELTNRFSHDVTRVADLVGRTPPWPRFADLAVEP